MSIPRMRTKVINIVEDARNEKHRPLGGVGRG